MAQQIGTGVRLYGFNQEDWIFTFEASAAIVTAWNNWRAGAAGSFNPVGRAVSPDFSNKDGQVTLAPDNGYVLGRIEAVEIRQQEGINVVAVATKFMQKMPKSDDAIAGNHTVTGAGNGLVKQAGQSDFSTNVTLQAAAQGTSEIAVLRP